MITNEQIRKTIIDCEKAGYTVRIRDIFYAFLTKDIEDNKAVYSTLFGTDKNFNADYAETFDKTNAISYLRQYIDYNFLSKNGNGNDEADISFEENKAGIKKLIDETRQAREKGDIKVSDALKIESDLRVKLNDKFNVAEDSKEQLVIVNTKYNAICPTCGHETYIPTKEDLMKQYNLVEKQ